MAEVTLHPDPQGSFPPGTVVQVFKRTHVSLPSGRPSGVVLSEPTVSASGALLVGGLEEDGEYVAWAQVGGLDRYLYFAAGLGAGQTETLNAAGAISGAFTPSWGVGTAVTGTMTGALTLEKPTDWPSAPAWMNLSLAQDGVGHSLKIGAGITMPGGEPAWSELPLAVNQFSLWSPDGGSTVYLFTGPEGKTGPRGFTGAAGETVGAIEALLKQSWPVVNGNSKATGTKPAVAWRMQRNMVVVPVKAKKLIVQWTPGAVKGKVRVVVFDTGQKTAGFYAVLADTEAFVAPGVEKVPGVLCELERKEGEWEAGQVVMVGIIAESTEMVLPIGTEPSAGASCQYPEGHAPHGVAVAKAWESDQVVLAEAGAKETPFKAVAEATPVAPAFPVAYRVMFA